MTVTSAPQVRVFISYSSTMEEQVTWVASLGERLMADGIDVVLDQWSLKDGHDLNAFMEQMVSDPTIKRVLVVSDSSYAKKADARKGGVGTESQIISKEVYDRVDQEKFIPLLRERDAEGKPCLPVFLKSRRYIDFTDQTAESDSYDQLLRNIYDRPLRKKPPLGQAPAHLFEESTVVVSAVSRAKRFVDFVLTGRGRPSAAFEDFSQEYLTNLEELRIAYSSDQSDTWCRTLLDNIDKSRIHRDILVDVIGAGIKHINEGWFLEALISLFEQIAFVWRETCSCGSFLRVFSG